MLHKQEVMTILGQNKQAFKAMGVECIGLFGSVVREENNESSDVDILVKFYTTAHTYRNFNQVCDLLENYFGEHYDLVTQEALSPYIKNKILQEIEYVSLVS